jgi:hypothetical protein
VHLVTYMTQSGCCYLIFVFLATSTVCRKSCRRKFCSDGVNILGSNEISGFAFGAVGELVAEFFNPPVFEIFSMFRSQRLQCAVQQCQFRGIRLTRQGNRM